MRTTASFIAACTIAAFVFASGIASADEGDLYRDLRNRIDLVAEPPSPPPPRTATAAVRTKRITITPRVGAFLPIGRLHSGPQGGLTIGVRLGAHSTVLLDGGFSSPTYTATGTDAQVGGAYMATIREYEMTVGLIGAYTWRLGSFDAYAGLGPLLYLLSAHETAFGSSSVEHQTRSGLVTATGIGHELGPGLLGIDLRVELATTDQMVTGNAGLHGVALSFAYAVSL